VRFSRIVNDPIDLFDESDFLIDLWEQENAGGDFPPLDGTIEKAADL